MENRKFGSKLMLYIFSAILVICQALIFLYPPLLPPGLELPFLLKCLPLLALIILWLKRFLFRGKRGVSWLKAFLWILVVGISLGALLEAEFSLFSLADQEKNATPVTMGDASNPKKAVLVYHPGGSGLVEKVNRAAALKLSQDGFQITLSTANAGLKITPRPGTLLGLASPVYFGSIRPPLKNFIERTGLTGVKCFVILTGSVDTTAEIEDLKRIIESKGGIFLGGRKFLSTTPPEDPEIESFVADIVKESGL